ncbi:MAG: rhodanese-related sulfurtransferase [Merismopediaceae bacterium]|nr:rhodanese-related sulfurtransferase [Merismopediaceae bacterium]
MVYRVTTFYLFVTLTDLDAKKATWQSLGQRLGLKGTILLATEGINGTIAGTDGAIAQMLEHLRQEPALQALTGKNSWTDHLPFERFKVKIKPEIVTLGQPAINPQDQVGTYVTPQDWNTLIQDPEVLLIDTRNQYEVAIGTFQGAINPETHHFREFPRYVAQHLDPQQHRKVAMFCTGGIRCEKASAYLLSQGFTEVYHLQGGILNYLETIPPESSLWQGHCFVFDQRVALAEGLTEGNYALCAACGHPLTEGDRQSPQYEAGIVCPHCRTSQTSAKRAKQERRLRQPKTCFKGLRATAESRGTEDQGH